MHEFAQLLHTMAPGAGLAERHLWWVRWLEWVRGGASSSAAARAAGLEPSHARLAAWLDALHAQPAHAAQFKSCWTALWDGVDASTLLADLGLALSHGFWGELGVRVRLKCLPMTPETTDAAELFCLCLHRTSDAAWLESMPPQLLQRLLGHWVVPPSAAYESSELTSRWQEELLQALVLCAAQVRATGLSGPWRQRLDAATRQTEPFVRLSIDVRALHHAFEVGSGTAEAAQALRERLAECRAAAQTVFAHLQDNGVSTDLVFALRQTRKRMGRMQLMLNALVGAKPERAGKQLVVGLMREVRLRKSVRALVAENTTLLAAKIAERSAQTGEHYIARSAPEYRQMLARAAGGGAVTALTTWGKFLLTGLGLAAFWSGFFTGLMYAASFVVIQLLHFTLATKQPAATAPAMAAKLKAMKEEGDVQGFVDEAACLARTQVAAVIGNVGLVLPCVLGISALLIALNGSGMLSAAEASQVLASVSVLSPSTLVFAAFTGVLLFVSSLVAGWADNAFVLHRLHSALQYNPRIASVLAGRSWRGQQAFPHVLRRGQGRALRVAAFLRQHVGGLVGNISLGLMLGLVPVFASFFGLGLEVRHVTLSMGQAAAALATLSQEQGWQVLRHAPLWWALAAVPFIGALNLCVSFALAFVLAAKANGLTQIEHRTVLKALWTQFLERPASFFLPTRY